jgi:hypothetical protein
MNSLYIVIGVMTLALECGRYDTKSIFTKLSHLILFVGCVIAFATGAQETFMVGVMLTIGVELIKAYRPRNTRASDKIKKRKLLS